MNEEEVEIEEILKEEIQSRAYYCEALLENISEVKSEMTQLEESEHYKSAMIMAQKLVTIYSELDTFSKVIATLEKSLILIKEDKAENKKIL